AHDLAQPEHQAAIGEAALDDLEMARRQLDMALEPAGRNLQPADRRAAHLRRQRPHPGHDQPGALDRHLDLLGGDAGQRDHHPERAIGLEQVDRRLPYRLPRRHRLKELAIEPLGAIEQLAGLGPHPGPGIVWRHHPSLQMRCRDREPTRTIRLSLATHPIAKLPVPGLDVPAAIRRSSIAPSLPTEPRNRETAMLKLTPARRRISRRSFLGRSAAVTGGLLALTAAGRRAVGDTAPAVVTSDRARPVITHGVQSGDVLADRAMIWSRADRPAQMMVEWSTEESLAGAERVVGPTALEDGDFTARVDLGGLPPDQPIFYRVTFQDLANPRAVSEPVIGRFRTAAMHRRNIRFVFSGDEAGQGWGINPGWGGYRLYEAMRAVGPDFFIHQ